MTMELADFVHLHFHTEYSLLDGAIRIEDAVRKAKEFHMPALAITDHGNLFGAYAFFEKAKKAGIKPILGCEFYVAPRGRGEKGEERKAADEKENVAYHLVLIATSAKGYHNLCTLLTAAYFEGYYYKPRIDKDILRTCSEGLVGLSACLKGEVASWVLKGDMEKARETALAYRDILGAGNFYFEIQENNLPEQRLVNDALVAMGKELDIPLVATNDCHYLTKDDHRFHDVLLCIQTGKLVHDEKRMRMTGNEYYVKSPQEMKERFAYAPEAIANTIRIAERCSFDFPDTGYHFPDLGIPAQQVERTFLEKVRKGLDASVDRLVRDAGGRFTRKDYEDRLEFECGIICKMGFPGYFLIVADFIEFARRRGVPVGPGRGSAAGSLVSYCLGITRIDPLKYDLLFERFLNVDRISMPDVDTDFCQDRRQEVIEYLVGKYGSDRVAQIITFGSMKARAVIKDVARAMELSFSEADKLSKLIGKAPTIKDAIEIEPELKQRYEKDPAIRELIDFSTALEKLPRQPGKHAAGVVIADRPLVEYMPIYKGKDGEALTQFDMKNIESMGLIKFDLLGLKTLTVIQDALRKIEKNHGVTIAIDELALDDPAVYELLTRGDTTGVFQFESQGMKDYLKKLKPTVFEDIIAMAALYRPGPLGSGMVDDFILRKHGKKEIVYDFPELEDVLKDTYGVIVYQEQVMLISNKLAGFTKGEADALRKVMGKKQVEKIPAMQEKFIGGAVGRGHDKAKVEKLFDGIAKFAEYGFNKSHSAAYALVAYQTAYLKAHYPAEFMAALLTSEISDTDKIVKHINEIRLAGTTVLPPDINESDHYFTVTRKGEIRFGLNAIKNVGKAALDGIIENRTASGPFTDFQDFIERVADLKVNKKVIESLIKSGALDSLGGHRAQYLEYFDVALEKVAERRKRVNASMVDMFGGTSLEERKPDVMPAAEPLPASQLLAFEKEVLGFYVSGHPLFDYRQEMEGLADVSCDQMGERSENEEVSLCGLVVSLQEKITKKGQKMAVAQLEDLSGRVEIVLFPDVYEKHRPLLGRDEPLFLKGSVKKAEDTPSVLVREVIPLGDAWSREIRSLAVIVDEDAVDAALLDELKNYLVTYKGRRPLPVSVVLAVEPDTEVKVAVPRDFWAEPTPEFCRNFATWFPGARLVVSKTPVNGGAA